MTIGKSLYNFYNSISTPEVGIGDIEIMAPFETEEVRMINKDFYFRYYNDLNPRVFLIGINPGRFGGGITGIPFTDPVNLQETLGIKNSFQKKHELSSQFVYSVIKDSGGPECFFRSFYLTAVSPVGFVMKNKNINYYDVKPIRENWELFFLESLQKQIQAGGNTEVAFILGQGENAKYLKRLNDKFQIFKTLIPLPHPRWVMQYRYRRRVEFADLYIKSLRPYFRD